MVGVDVLVPTVVVARNIQFSRSSIRHKKKSLITISQKDLPVEVDGVEVPAVVVTCPVDVVAIVVLLESRAWRRRLMDVRRRV